MKHEQIYVFLLQDCYTLSLRAVAEEVVQVVMLNTTVVDAINSESPQSDSGIHYILKGLFEHFLPTQSDNEDFQWLLEIANNHTVMQMSCISPTARCIRQCIFVMLTARKYEQNHSEQNILDMLLDKEVHYNFCAWLDIVYFSRVQNCKL